MGRQKKTKENAIFHEKDDEGVGTVSKIRMLPEIPQGPTRMIGVSPHKNPGHTENQYLMDTYRRHNIDMPSDAKSRRKFESYYCDEATIYHREHQAKMNLVAGRMVKKNTQQNDIKPAAMLKDGVYNSTARYHPARNGQYESLDGFDCYGRQVNVSNVDRERELDKKRQALLEIKNKQAKFNKKCKDENKKEQDRLGKTKDHIEGHTKKEKKRKKADTDQRALVKEYSNKTVSKHEGFTAKETNVQSRVANWLQNQNHPVVSNIEQTQQESLPPILNQHDVRRALPQIESCRQMKNSSPTCSPSQQTNRTIYVTFTMMDQTVVPLASQFEHQNINQASECIASPLIGVVSPSSKIDSDISLEYEKNNTLGIADHVVTDEELRQELKLDLSFARTPVYKKSKKSATDSMTKIPELLQENACTCSCMP